MLPPDIRPNSPRARPSSRATPAQPASTSGHSLRHHPSLVTAGTRCQGPLACAELLELKAADDVSRTRAAEVVAKVLDAMGTAKEIRHKTDLL